MASRLEKLAYEAKYTAGTYIDSIISIPIWTADKIAKGSRKVLGKYNPKFLGPDWTTERSLIYKGRQKLRDTLDTRPGALYIQSNMVAIVPFFLVGMPAAEMVSSGIEHLASEAHEMVNHIGTSLGTLACQMTTAYATFIANEVRTNTQKYRSENKKLSPKKIGKLTWDAVKTFWKFDITYIGIKTAIQTAYLVNNQDPWEASALADTWAIPAWYSVAIPLGLKGNLIETNRSQEMYRHESTIKTTESTSSDFDVEKNS